MDCVTLFLSCFFEYANELFFFSEGLVCCLLLLSLPPSSARGLVRLPFSHAIEQQQQQKKKQHINNNS